MPTRIRPLKFVGDRAYVPLSRGEFAVIDAGDAHLVNKFNWYLLVNQTGRYAYRQYTDKTGKRVSEYMHRVILSANENVFVDHIDHNGLNNTRSNIRLCSVSQNQMNRRTQSNNTSGHKGVSWDKSRKKWKVRVCVERVEFFVGRFESLEDACQAYVKENRRMHKEFSCLED